jgi:hypothetical protein
MALAIPVEEPRLSEVDAPVTQPAGTVPRARTMSRVTPALALFGLIGLFVAGATLPVPALVTLRTKIAERATTATSTLRERLGAPTIVTQSERLVELDLSISPPDAKVTLDGHPISNPLRIAYPYSNRKHELRAEAPQHESRTLQLTFERDVQVELSLPRLAATTVPTNPTAGSTPLP